MNSDGYHKHDKDKLVQSYIWFQVELDNGFWRSILLPEETYILVSRRPSH